MYKTSYSLKSAYLFLDYTISVYYNLQDIRLRPRKEKNLYEEPQMKVKRKHSETSEDDEEDIPLKMIKSYDLSDFENFSYEFYVEEGICSLIIVLSVNYFYNAQYLLLVIILFTYFKCKLNSIYNFKAIDKIRKLLI